MHLRLEALKKSFGFTKALDGVDLEIAPGNVVAVLGENGAGKSTLLRLLAAVCAADRGAVLMDGVRFDRENLSLRMRTHFTPELPLLFFKETVARNIAIVSHLYGRNLEERAAQIAAFMEESGIGALGHRIAGNLSRGQMWKTALACVAAAEPELWLVDEPFASGMDAMGMAAFRRLARARTDAGGTVIYTTQMVDLAAAFSDRVCVLREGKVVLWETADVGQALVAGPGGEEAVLKGARTAP